MRRSGILVAAVLIVGALGVGCGGGDSKSASSTSSSSSTSAGSSTSDSASSSSSANNGSGAGFAQPCPDAGEVSKIVGHDLAVDGEQSNRFCQYGFEDTATADSISVIYVWSAFDLTQEESGVEVEQVSGVGERATWDDTSGNLAVWTGKSSVLLTFFPIGFPDIDQKNVAIELAKLVL